MTVFSKDQFQIEDLWSIYLTRPRRLGDPFWLMFYLARRKLRWAIFEQKRWEKLSEEEKIKEIDFYIINLDKVPKHIIAEVKIPDVYDLAPPCFKPIIRWGLDDGSHDEPGSPKSRHAKEAHSAIPERPKEEAARIHANKKWPPVMVSHPTADLIDSLAGEENEKSLLVKDHQARKKADGYYANVFVVDKTKINPLTNEFYKRFITDCRVANSRLVNIAKMELFTLETLMSRVAMCLRRGAQTMFSASADLRHWFHQLPFPRQFRRYAGMSYRDKNGDFKTVYPRMWPMGFAPAPGFAQAVTWSMLLHRLCYKPLPDKDASLEQLQRVKEYNDKVREERLKLDVDPDQDFEEYLQWLPLKNGGAVFVLIDNIFVVSPSEAAATAWRSNIVSSTNRFHATLKQERHGEKEFDGFQENILEDVEFVKITFNEPRDHTTETEDKNFIDFSGIRISGKGRKVARDVDAVAALENVDPLNPQEIQKLQEDWTPTFRDLASVLGQCLWVLRVQGVPMIEMTQFVDIYGIAYPKEGKGEKWDSKCHFSPTHLEHLKNLVGYYHRARKNVYVGFESPMKDIDPADMLLLATDAAGGDDKGLGFVYQPLLGQAEMKSMDRDQLPRHVFKEIVYGELQAVLEALKEIFLVDVEDHKIRYRVEGQRSPKIIFLAIDNIAAMHMLHRNYSKKGLAREILIDINKLLSHFRSRLILYYVKSELNPADAGSRGRALCSVCLRKFATLKALVLKYSKTMLEELRRSNKTRILAHFKCTTDAPSDSEEDMLETEE